MNPMETVVLTRYVRALCPQQKFDEYTPDAWHDVLAPYELDDARAAVTGHVASGNSFVSVAEIVSGIKDIRERRIAEAHAMYDGRPDEIGRQSAESIRALTDAAASGKLPPREVRAALESGGGTENNSQMAQMARDAIGRSVPKLRDGVVNVLAVPCPHCLAPAKRTCRAFGKSMPDAHPARLEDARRIAAGQPPVDQEQVRAEERQRREAARLALAAEGPSVFVPPTRAEVKAAEGAAKAATS